MARIVEASKDLVCAYKPQIAYFAALGAEDQLEAICAYLNLPLTKASVRRFADMEVFVEILENVRGGGLQA